MRHTSADQGPLVMLNVLLRTFVFVDLGQSRAYMTISRILKSNNDLRFLRFSNVLIGFFKDLIPLSAGVSHIPGNEDVVSGNLLTGHVSCTISFIQTTRNRLPGLRQYNVPQIAPTARGDYCWEIVKPHNPA